MLLNHKDTFIKPNLDSKKIDLGFDCWFSKKIFNTNPDIVYEDNNLLVFDKRDLKCFIKNIPKLSTQEKNLFKKFLDYIKELPSTNVNKDLEKYYLQFLQNNKLILDLEQKKYMFDLLNYEINNFGIITPLIQDKNKIEEITITGIGEDYPVNIYLSNIGWCKTQIYFTDDEYITELINKMARSIGRQISLNNPILNASLNNGSRLNAIIPPISGEHPTITLRKFKYNPLTPIDLINYNTINLDLATFLWLAMQTDSNILIAGNTGSGKTTTLNALFSFVPKSERIIICEETPEVNIPHKHKVKLKIEDKRNIHMQDLIICTLRMRPDRLIVGEIRSKEEVSSFIDTILAGQGKGSFATFHGLSSKDTIERLLKLGTLEQDLNALDLIILQRRWNNIDIENNLQKEIRKIIDICEIIDNKLIPIYQYNYETNTWIYLNKSEKIRKKIEIIYNKDYDKIFYNHKKRLEELMYKKQNMGEFFEDINQLWQLDKYDKQKNRN